MIRNLVSSLVYQPLTESERAARREYLIGAWLTLLICIVFLTLIFGFLRSDPTVPNLPPASTTTTD